jgi:hypothetical protein
MGLHHTKKLPKIDLLEEESTVVFTRG